MEEKGCLCYYKYKKGSKNCIVKNSDMNIFYYRSFN